jgi:hypothetical protein
MIIEYLTMVLLDRFNFFVLWLLMEDDDLD